MNKKITIGVMGSGSAKEFEIENAETLGKLIAENEWITLSGGGGHGVMEAVSKGAYDAGGVVIGIAMGDMDTSDMTQYVTAPIYTNMHSGRNYTNVLSSDVVVAASDLTLGTNSEVALALTENKNVILMSKDVNDREYYLRKSPTKVHIAESPEEVIKIIKSLI